MKGLAILGSTGSIGVSALEVAGEFPGHFRVVALAAGRNVEVLAHQIRRFRPSLVSVRGEDERRQLLSLLAADNGPPDPEVLCGDEGPSAVAGHPEAEIVLTAMVGAAGLRPTLAAIRRGATVAIANKEPLVVAGRLCVEAAEKHGATLLPVDSEHSAIFQCLRGNRLEDVRRLILTGSGGPFRTVPDLERVTLEQALAHPTWSMGPKITVDSATLMNKGLEVIEARWLFEVPAERIEVVIHPQSVIHSMVEYVDGSVVAQLGMPEMKIPIAYALGYPARLAVEAPRLEPTRVSEMTFEPPDTHRFPCLGLAYEALRRGGPYPAVLNAANEVAVEAFLGRRIRFVEIPRLVEHTLSAQPWEAGESLGELIEADRRARLESDGFLRQIAAP
jgi:1-deoxy-D-xylulose-5-phosphate reductoisomerase